MCFNHFFKDKFLHPNSSWTQAQHLPVLSRILRFKTTLTSWCTFNLASVRESQQWGNAGDILRKQQHVVYIPIGSTYGICTYIYHEHQPNVGEYTIYGSHGIELDAFMYIICMYLCGPCLNNLGLHPNFWVIFSGRDLREDLNRK